MDTWNDVGPAWIANHRFVKTQCTIKATRENTVQNQRLTSRYFSYFYIAQFLVVYKADYKDSVAWANYSALYKTSDTQTVEGFLNHIFDKFNINSNYPCWYNPENPSQVILSLKYDTLRTIYDILMVLFLTYALGASFWYSFFEKSKAGSVT